MMWAVLIAFLVVIGVLYVLAELYLPKGGGRGRTKPVALEYEACGPLLTDVEAAFYPVLVEAARAGPEACLVMCKVRLGDLVRPKRRLDKDRKSCSASRATVLRNRANQKHVDFVVVRASDFGIRPEGFGLSGVKSLRLREIKAVKENGDCVLPIINIFRDVKIYDLI